MPAALRLGAIGLGGGVVLVCFLASPRRESLPALLVALMSGAAVTLAILAGVTSLKASFSRAAGMILGLVGLASLLRLIAVVVAFQSAAPGGARLVMVARGVATAGFVAGLLAMAIAAAWIASRSRKLASPGTLVPLALALFLTQKALHADGDDAGALSVLVRRAVDLLIARPLPVLPAGLQIFAALLAPLLAIGALTSRPARGASAAALAPPAIGAAIALALLVRDAPDMPLGALSLVVAGLTAALAAHDDRGVWDAITAAPRSTEEDRAASSARQKSCQTFGPLRGRFARAKLALFRWGFAPCPASASRPPRPVALPARGEIPLILRPTRSISRAATRLRRRRIGAASPGLAQRAAPRSCVMLTQEGPFIMASACSRTRKRPAPRGRQNAGATP